MEWIWRELAHYVRATATLDISGISAEELYDILHQGALDRLMWITALVFNEEISDAEKVSTIQEWILEDQYTP